MEFMLIVITLLLYATTSYGGQLNSEFLTNDRPLGNLTNRSRRAAPQPIQLWPDGTVYYYYSKDILGDSLKLENIKKAMSYVTEETCVRFEEKQKAKNKVQYRKNKNDCWSSYGAGTDQEIVIDDYCGGMVDFQIRNLMHILGFLPSLARKDRDKFVNLSGSKFLELAAHYKYIPEIPETGNELLTPYEYGSVLHWKGLSHTSFTTKDELYQNSVGTLKTTFLDMKMVNLVYCKGSCKWEAAKCNNGGYPNPNKCSVCNCPDGYGGDLCDTRPKGPGKFLQASHNLKSVDVHLEPITSENNSTFNRANYMIVAPNEAEMEFKITSLDDKLCNAGCTAGGAEVNMKNPPLSGFRICCSNFVNKQLFTEEGDIIALEVYSRSLPVKFTFTYRIGGPGCDDGTWVRAEESKKNLCFKAIPFSTLPSTYATGRALCESIGAFAAPFRGENDRLAIRECPNSNYTTELAISTAIDRTTYKKTSSKLLGFFLGIRNVASSRTSKGDFRYEYDSSPISFSPWSAENPSISDWGAQGWEQCVIAGVNDNLNWNDVLCNNDPLQDHIGIVCAKRAVMDGESSGGGGSEKKPVPLPVESKPIAPPAESKPVPVPVEQKPAPPPVESKPIHPSVAEKPVAPPAAQKPEQPKVNLKCDDESWAMAHEDEHYLCFKAILYSKLPSTFADGKKLCKSKFKAFVAPFRGENDRVAIRAAVNKSKYKKTSSKLLGFFIGILNVAGSHLVQSDFRYEHNKSPIYFSSWSDNGLSIQDHGKHGWEQCVTALVNNNLDWNDALCNVDPQKNHIGIICAKQPVPIKPGKGNKFLKESNKKFKLVVIALSLLLYAPTSFGGPPKRPVPEDDPTFDGIRHRRAADKLIQRWPNATVYYYNSKEIAADQHNVANIKKAMNYITERTCVRFQENQKATNKFQYRKINNDCFSSYGAGANQEIAIDDWCGGFVDLQVRNLMHILGFLPTLARKDRDDFVKVDSSKFKDLPSHFKYIADKPETGIELQTPYEYGSVLHWKELGSVPFTTRDELYQNSAGGWKTTFLDMKMVNLAYCKDSCKKKAAQCKNGGYPNPNKCSVCNCPDGYGGTLCDERPAGPGELLQATPVLKSVDVSLAPIAAEKNSTFNRAYYMITAPKGAVIEFQITSLDNKICSTGCGAGGAEVNMKDPPISGFRICCSNFVNKKLLTTEGNLIALEVYSRSLPVKFTFTYKIAGPRCEDDSWIQSVEGQTPLCFKAITFSNIPTTYATGRALCESIGAFAAPFRGENDRMAIKAAIDKTNYKKTSSEWLGFFVGIRNVADSPTAKGDFRNEHDSSSITYSTWSTRNPSMSVWEKLGWEQCVVAEVNNNLNWNDALCDNDDYSNHIGIVCAKKEMNTAAGLSSNIAASEKKPAAPPASKKPDQTKVIPKCDDETWTMATQDQIQLCFKALLFPKLPSTFANGKSLCESIGALAAPFRGENDRQAIQAAIDKTNYKKSSSRWMGFFIGIRNVANSRTAKGDFRTEHDSSSISYLAWSAPNPNMEDWGKDGWEQCVIAEVNNNLNWNDALCNNDPLQDHIGIVCAKKASTEGQSSVIAASEKKPVAPPLEQKIATRPVELKPVAPAVEQKPVQSKDASEKKPVAPLLEQKIAAPSVQAKPAVPPVEQKPAAVKVNLKCDDETWAMAHEGKNPLCFKAILYSKLPSTYADGESLRQSKLNAFPAPFRGENDRVAIQAAIDKTNYKKSTSQWLGFFLGIRNVVPTRTLKADFRFDLDSYPISYTSWRADSQDMGDWGKDGWEQCVTTLVNHKLNWNDALCDNDPLKDHIGMICAKLPIKAGKGTKFAMKKDDGDNSKLM